MSDVAVIGCGRIAWKLEQDPLRYKPCTHLGALRYWQRRRSISLSGFCDLQVENAQGAARFMAMPEALVTNDFRKIISLKPDVLVIAASTAPHCEILTAALRAGIPRIVMEKPVAFSAREARKLRALLKRSQSVVLPNYERRYHPKYLKLCKKLADARSYRGFFAAGGKSLYALPKSGDEGVLLHDTTHLLDLAQFFFGTISRVEKIAGKRRHLLYLEHENGTSGVLETALAVGAFHLELEVHTPKARFVVGNGFLSTEVIRHSPYYKGLKSYAAPQRVTDKKLAVAQNPFVKLYESALNGKPDNTHFEEALRNVEILALL